MSLEQDNQGKLSNPAMISEFVCVLCYIEASNAHVLL